MTSYRYVKEESPTSDVKLGEMVKDLPQVRELDNEQLKSDLRNFLQFACETKIISGDVVIKSSINVFNKSPISRSAILSLFGQLFEDAVEKYIDEHYPMRSNKLDTSTLWRLVQRPADPMAKGIVKERKSIDSQGTIDGDTPMSPPMMETTEIPVEQDEININTRIQKYINWIGETLEQANSNGDATCRQLIVDWSLQFTSILSGRYAMTNFIQSSITNPVQIFTEYINFWIKCPVVELILKIIMSYASSSSPSFSTLSQSTVNNCQAILLRLIDFSPGSDWISAHLIASLPSHANSFSFSSCIETLLQSNASQISKTNILSYISEHNPQAIINASRTNIPFLLKLAANSKPLLNLLSVEAVKQVNIKMLNDLSITLKENLQPPVIYCILNAPNSYELLLLVFDACSHPDANENVRKKGFSVLQSIVSHIHEIAYSTNVNYDALILDILRDNLDHLVARAITRSTGNLKRLQTRIVQLLCLHFGVDFSAQVLHQILNSFDTNLNSFNLIQPPNPILVNLIRSLKLPFGSLVHKCFKKAVQSPSHKNANFWANLLALVDLDESIELDIDIMTEEFTNHMQSGHFDQKLFYILKLISCCIEKSPKTLVRPKHNLCISIVSTYMKILNLIESDNNELELRMFLVSTVQKLMSQLSKGQISNQHILSRALIETELRRSENVKMEETQMPYVSMFNENLQYGGPTKFRKISLNPRRLHRINGEEKRSSNSSIRNQLLVDAIKCCIVDTQAFASLLVECVTPDVMFNDKPWPDEDFQKVTIERDLSVARKFESNPVLWDFCELIANANCLQHCSILIQALMAVQLCRWSSATAKMDKLEATQRLVSLIASSELVPSLPFKHIPQVMAELTPWEIFCILNDLWRYLRDNSPTNLRPNQGSIRPYLERLRIISFKKLPGPLFVKIFKNLD